MAYWQKVEGPTHVVPPTPPRPQAYWSCVNCAHYHTQHKMEKDANAGTSVHKVCHHPLMVTNRTMCLESSENVLSDAVTKAPDCCPYMDGKSHG